MGLQLLAGPAEEPITLAEARAQCNLETDADDDLLTFLIGVARDEAEKRTGRALVSQQWRATLDNFPQAAIDLKRPPLISVDAFTYTDPDGQIQTLEPSAYRVHTSGLLAMLTPPYGQRWPQARQDIDAITIDFTAGYGAAANVPAAIKFWMRLFIGTGYRFRESITDGASITELPRGMWDSLLDEYRVWRYG